MAPKHRIIVDTDPGVDDILALLLALSSDPIDLEVELISVTYGNVDVQNCLRNVVSMFHQIEKEMAWRKTNGRPEGFEMLKRQKPLVAIGPDKPLADQIMMADFFHGIDGLGGISESHPHLTPAEAWRDLFTSAVSSNDENVVAAARELQTAEALFSASKKSGHEEILRILAANEPDTITIVAIGPLTNIAMAAATDPETFLRVRELVVMGGAVEADGNVQVPSSLHNPPLPEPPFRLIKQPPGPLRTKLMLRNQITPVAEFNIFADSVAAARVFALTSPNPHSTMPPTFLKAPGQSSKGPPPPFMQPYPEKLSRQLKLTLFPLDVTCLHNLTRTQLNQVTAELLSSHSPLAEWTAAFLAATFRKIESLRDASATKNGEVSLALHDPLTIWYLLMGAESSTAPFPRSEPQDIRIETGGQWTKGMCVVDRRRRVKKVERDVDGEQQQQEVQQEVLMDFERQRTEKEAEVLAGEGTGSSGNASSKAKDPDHGTWLDTSAGNRIVIPTSTGWEQTFGQEMLRRIFGL